MVFSKNLYLQILKIEVTSQNASLEDAKDHYYFTMEVMQNLIL